MHLFSPVKGDLVKSQSSVFLVIVTWSQPGGYNQTQWIVMFLVFLFFCF